MDKIEKIDCTTCKYGYEDERLGIPMCHHPKRFSEDCIDFNMHEEKRLEDRFNKSLDEAAEEAATGLNLGSHLRFIEGFKAGAEWKESQMPMPEDTVLFNKDVAEGRRLEMEDMMNDAVEGVLVDNIDGTQDICLHGKRFGQKVRIIVIKDESK